MTYASIARRAIQGIVLSAVLSSGLAMAQEEPTLNQVYAAAQAGKLDQAQVMIQQVLVAHPKSARAYFVRSELFARQGDFARARESLAEAEKLAPGLPFAKADAVQALRSELSATKAQSSTPTRATPAAPAPAPSSSSWGLPLLLAGGVIAIGYFMFRRRTAQPAFAQPAAYATPGGPGGMAAPQPYGPQPYGPGGAGGAGYGQPAYGQPPAGSGMGGRIAGGLATGLAVGAGVMAAEAIGRNLMGGHNQNGQGNQNNLSMDDFGRNDADLSKRNADMGGQNFGVNDAASWDDGGSTDAGSGSSDWDT